MLVAEVAEHPYPSSRMVYQKEEHRLQSGIDALDRN